jgi:hypothetical protein
MKTIMLVWYHSGFRVDPPELVAVCDSIRTARVAELNHMRTRDPAKARPDREVWWRRRRRVFTLADVDGTSTATNRKGQKNEHRRMGWQNSGG